MCKTTAVDVGMCLPKCFVFVVNLITFLLGALLVGASIYGMKAVEKSLGHGSLDILFYIPIAFGSIIVFISFFGCCGACFKSRCMLMTFAIFLLIVFSCQVGVVYYIYHVYAQLTKSAKGFLTDTIKSSKDNEIYRYIWEFIQQSFECCGVKSFKDWQGVTENLPMSCCPMRNETMVAVETMQNATVLAVETMQNATVLAVETMQNATCTQTDAFENGCKTLVTDYTDVLFHPITVTVTVVLTIQLINLILSCCMFFVYGCTNEKRKNNLAYHGYVDVSPETVHAQFIVKKDQY